MSRKEIRPEDLTVVIDTREKRPLVFSKMKTIRKSLPTGDYSILGLEKHICVERKSLPDLLMCVGRERKRFDEEMQRMLAYEARAIIVEAPKVDCIQGTERSKVHPNAVEGSLIGWNGQIHIEFAANPTQAARYVSWFLWVHAKRRWEESKFLLKGLGL